MCFAVIAKVDLNKGAVAYCCYFGTYSSAPPGSISEKTYFNNETSEEAFRDGSVAKSLGF